MPRNCRFLRSAVVLMFVASAGQAAAQEVSSFAALRYVLRTGETVQVTDDAGKIVSGRIVQILPDALEISVASPKAGSKSTFSRQRLSSEDVRTIARNRGDSIVNGMLVGAGVGLGGGIGMWAMAGGCDCYDAGAWMQVFGPYVAIGAGAGALIDAVLQEKTTVYRLQSGARAWLSPAVSKSGSGIQLSLRF
jgi:hypothetical protein